MDNEKISLKECERCAQIKGTNSYLQTKSLFYPKHLIPICNTCLIEIASTDSYKSKDNEESPSWQVIDKICQYIDIPFLPSKWEELVASQARGEGARAIIPYVKLFSEPTYQSLNWTDQQKSYIEFNDQKKLKEQINPQIQEKLLKDLQEKWGANYSGEELNYLESLYDGIKTTQSINGALQFDQALKLCRLSLAIDSRIREGDDVDKLLGSYEKIIKAAEFTPKNVKNAQDFDSVGELFCYLEKTGFINKFYDGAKRDVVDITMNNIQNFCQKLYTNEPGITEDITKRLEVLSSSNDEDQMGIMDDYTSDDTNQEVDDYFGPIEDEGEFNPRVE